MKKITILSVVVLALTAFTFFTEGEKPVAVPPSKQRVGNAAKGYEYLVGGDYVKGGIPYNIFLMGAGRQKVYLQREGLNQKLPHDYTAVKAPNGETLVAPNCLQCHAQVFNDSVIIGLGNSLVNFTQQRMNANGFALLERMLKANSPRQYEAALPFLEVTKAIGPYLYVPTQGVNVADRLAAVLVAHRDPGTFKWNSNLALNIPEEVIPTDTPPWWLLKKKNAMFYNGFGRGDFGRFLMASNLLTVNDTAESREVDGHMPDVLAYIYSLKPPKYPGVVNGALAKKGQAIFEARCSGCHGTYGSKSTYPNLLIPESIIQTDSLLYKSNYSQPQFVNWFNKSWFTSGDHPAKLVPFEGYIAPPLDGIWVTAPYLHNGSIPTLEGVLNSKARPTYWSRNFEQPQYDPENMGWKYTVEEKPGGTQVYNTERKGYGNYGHYFGDRLSAEERKAVLEYLKTL